MAKSSKVKVDGYIYQPPSDWRSGTLPKRRLSASSSLVRDQDWKKDLFRWPRLEPSSGGSTSSPPTSSPSRSWPSSSPSPSLGRRRSQRREAAVRSAVLALAWTGMAGAGYVAFRVARHTVPAAWALASSVLSSDPPLAAARVATVKPKNAEVRDALPRKEDVGTRTVTTTRRPEISNRPASNSVSHDEEIAALVREQLVDERFREVRMRSGDGVVELSGAVPNFRALDDAENFARRVDGVRHVENLLTLDRSLEEVPRHEPRTAAVHRDERDLFQRVLDGFDAWGRNRSRRSWERQAYFPPPPAFSYPPPPSYSWQPYPERRVR